MAPSTQASNSTPNPSSTTPTRPSLPIIDISPFLTPNSTPASRHQTATAIHSACTTYGFFYLTGHGIPLPLLTYVLSLARTFFSLPPSKKNKIKRHPAHSPQGGDGARGYQALGENITQGQKDIHEAIDWYREWAFRSSDEDYASLPEEHGDGETAKCHATLQGPNLWPEDPPELKPTYLDYISRVQTVGTALVRAMGQALNLPLPDPDSHPNKETEDADIFVRNTRHSFWVMRMIGYPPLPPTPSPSPTQQTPLSCGAHTDYGCVTLLHADSTPGALQVLLKDGETWIDADPVEGAFVVNIGDMIERWTGGMWKSTRHRVVHAGKGYRVSLPFFFEPDFGAVVRPLGVCGGGEGNGEGGEQTYGEYLLGKVFGNFGA